MLYHASEASTNNNKNISWIDSLCIVFLIDEQKSLKLCYFYNGIGSQQIFYIVWMANEHMLQIAIYLKNKSCQNHIIYPDVLIDFVQDTKYLVFMCIIPLNLS